MQFVYNSSITVVPKVGGTHHGWQFVFKREGGGGGGGGGGGEDSSYFFIINFRIIFFKTLFAYMSRGGESRWSMANKQTKTKKVVNHGSSIFVRG